MPRSPRSTPSPVRFPDPWLPVVAPARGATAVATYLRAHLYGAAVGRSILDRCISAVEPADRVRLVPLRAEFDREIDTAAALLRRLSVVGAPGRGLLRTSSAVTLAALPVGPVLRDPLARLAVLETLRTLVVAKRSMWELLAASWVADDPAPGGDDDELRVHDTGRLLRGLAEQARAQEELLEQLRRAYGLAVFG
ncbi:hypothetical protein HMPREF3086_01230 [Dietzia sp. HMSC21D01]|uniref:Uncharacterized protein n=1 Tax=Dietzia cinnamea TaxID=321318 RepID=A0AAW5QC94_9ACTN|nr:MULTISPECIES: hypothetical protein [Dietzia]MBM7229443.1 hypothetical protein [Dietzia cinnamea]MCT1863635.1 hypothetical protein [Dietzia cinnamea]MCT2030653.1 hypothetical protein [Dietzia cinnamea]MCT2033739.1 hypothetical protein [Dietzia cinnamea]MCT2077091.1 hypothetical protein [Dietzia cinnamea]